MLDSHGMEKKKSRANSIRSLARIIELPLLTGPNTTGSRFVFQFNCISVIESCIPEAGEFIPRPTHASNQEEGSRRSISSRRMDENRARIHRIVRSRVCEFERWPRPTSGLQTQEPVRIRGTMRLPTQRAADGLARLTFAALISHVN